MKRRSPLVRRRVSAISPLVEGLETRALLAPLIYAESDASKLYTIDVEKGTAHFVADTTQQLTDIAFDADGNLYGVDLNGMLYGVDSKSGVTTAIGSAEVMLNALAFAPDGTLFAAGNSGLFAINPTTGAGRLVADLSGFPSAGDLTFDASGNLVLSTTNPTATFVRVDTSTGDITPLGDPGSNDIYGLSYGPDGVLYGATFSSREFQSVDPETGQTSQVSLYDGDQISKIYGTAFTDEARRPGITVSDARATAPLSGTGSLDFTISLAYASVRPVSVSFATSNGTATAPANYTATTGTVTFAPGETTKLVSVPIVGKAVYLPSTTLHLNLQDAKNGLLLAKIASGTVDVAAAIPTLSLSLDQSQFDENGGVTTVKATLSAASGIPTTVNLGFSGSAVRGKNYSATANSLVIPAGEISASLSLTGQDDNTITGPLAASISIAGVTGAAPVGTQTVSATEADSTALPGIAINSTAGSETSSTFSFVVTLSKSLNNAVSVAYSTNDGTAVQGLDYAAVSGKLDFSAGETQKTIQVPILNNPAYKRDKSFSLTLGNPIHANLVGNPGVGIVVNTVAPPKVSIDDASTLEGNRKSSPASVTVRLSSPSELPASILVETRGLSAKAGKDYVPVRTMVNFLPGETVKTVAISILGNTKKQQDRTLALDLRSDSGVTVAKGQGIVKIIDDDGHKRVVKRALVVMKRPTLFQANTRRVVSQGRAKGH